MKPAISICLFCREDSAASISETLLNISATFKALNPDIMVVSLVKDRAMEEYPGVRFSYLQGNGVNPLKFALHQAKTRWLFFLWAGESLRTDEVSSLAKLLENERSGRFFLVPLSFATKEGWQPAFSPRLAHKESLATHIKGQGSNLTFLKSSVTIVSKAEEPRKDLTIPFFGLSEKNSDSANLYLLAERYLKQKNHTKARNIFSRVHQLEGDPLLRRFLTFKKIYCQVNSRQETAAMEELSRAQNHYPHPVEFTYLKGDVLFKQRRHKESLLSFEEAGAQTVSASLPWAPENYRITTARAKVLAVLGQNEGALDACIHALACCPGYLPALRILARIVLNDVSQDGIRTVYKHAAPLKEEKFAAVTRLFAENNRHMEAYACLKTGLKERPGNPELLYLKALCSLKSGHVLRCLAILRRIPAESTFFKDAFLLQCVCYWSLKDFRRALATIEFREEEVGDEREICRYLHYHLMHRQHSLVVEPFLPCLEKYDDLFMDILRLSLHLKNRDILYTLVALAKDRDQGGFCLRLAKFFAQKKEDELAVTFFNQAMDKGVYDSESLLVIGKIALEGNLFPEARELFSLALKNFPQDANIYLFYTRTLLKEAFLTLVEGLRKNPDDKTLANTLKDVQETFLLLEKLKLHI